MSEVPKIRVSSLQEALDAEAIQAGLHESAKRYEGTVIFAPSMTEIAEAMGLSYPSEIYEYLKSVMGYHEKLKTVTRKEIIHNGLVLGDPKAIDKDLDLPEVEIKSMSN